MTTWSERIDEILDPVLHYCTKFPCKRCDKSRAARAAINEAVKTLVIEAHVPVSDKPGDSYHLEPAVVTAIQDQLRAEQLRIVNGEK